MRGKNTSKAPGCPRKEKMCFVPGLQGTRGLKLDAVRLHIGRLGGRMPKQKYVFL